jgi:multiple sugar transport system permease protein
MKKLYNFLAYALGIILVVCFLVPTLWLFLTSFKTRVDTFAMPPKFLFRPILENYIQVLGNAAFMRYYLNSLVVGVLTTLACLVVGLPAAYAFSAFKWKGQDDLAFWILSTRMAPPILVVLPFYLMFRKLGLLDTRLGLVIVYSTFSLSFIVWMMRGYFSTVPKELEESCRIDGATRLVALIRVVLPICSPGIAASAVFIAITSWNEYFYALILSGRRAQTLPVAINGFITLNGIRWGEVAAAGTLILIPVLAFGILVRRYLVSGLTMGAVK